MRKRIFSIAIFFVFISALLHSSNQSSKKLTIEKIFSPSLMMKLNVPQFTWIQSNKALLYDYKVSITERTIELLEPSTGERKAAIDKEKFVNGLKKNLGKKAASFIFWPSAIDQQGKVFLYEIQEDLFCYDLINSTWHRLTSSDARETSSTFSPDGNWVSFVRDNDLYAIEWKTGKDIRLTTGGSETLLNGPLSWVYWEEIYEHTSVPYQWSPDSKAIAYLQTDDAEVSVSTFVDFKPETQAVVRQRYPKAGQTNPRVRLGIVELSSAQTCWMVCGEYEYLARFNWLRGSQEIAIQTLNRQQNKLRLLFADRRAGKSREILVERQPAWINLNNALYFLKDGKRFIWLSERDGYQHLYLYETSGRFLRQLTKGKFMVQSSAGALVTRNKGLVGVDEESGWVYFTSNQQSLQERHLYRIGLDGTGLKRISQKRGVHIPAFCPSMKYYLSSYSNTSTPPEFSLYKANGKSIKTISPSAINLLKDIQLASREFHTYKTEDELEIPLMITKPVNFDPKKKYPAVVYIYGGPGAQVIVDRWIRWFWDDLLAQEGFFTFSLDVRAGMGKSKALETSVYKRAYGMQNVKDILDAVRWIAQKPYIDPKRLGIWGGSGGGCTTLYTMTHSDIFKAGISLYPVSDWHYYDTIYTERYMDTPQNNPDGYKETSSVLAAKNLKGRLLIVHGTYDDNVHPQNTYGFIDQLIKHNIQFDLMIYPWKKHGIGYGPAQIHLRTLMLDFWRKNLK